MPHWLLYPWVWPSTHCARGWVGPWTGVESLAPTWIWALDHPAYSELLHWLHFPSPTDTESEKRKLESSLTSIQYEHIHVQQISKQKRHTWIMTELYSYTKNMSLTPTLWHWWRAYKTWNAIHLFSMSVRNGRVLMRSYKLYLTYSRIINPAFSVNCNKTIMKKVLSNSEHGHKSCYERWNI